MEFNPINTQEEFDAAISERLKREKETLTKKYSDYDELKKQSLDLQKQLGDANKALEDMKSASSTHEQSIADLTNKVKSYETSALKSRIAIEAGIPYELANRLSGEDEDSIRKDAEALSRLVVKSQLPPLKSTESGGADSDDPYRALARSIGE